jgi:tetratricopeptide (TPR) repeat protein
MDNVQDSDFWKDQGNNYYKTGNYIDAIISYKRALEINPGSDKAWYNLGMTYNRMNNKKDSRSCFEKSQELSGSREENHGISRSPPTPGLGKVVTRITASVEKNRTTGQEDAMSETNWRDLLYPGEWSVRFVLVGLITSVSDQPVFIFMYYTCAIAALVALGFLLLGLVKHVKGLHPPIPDSVSTKRSSRNANPLSTSSMNVRTWAIFFLICFVALLWAVFLSNQGLMLWVSFALVMIVAGFNLIFIFRN